MGCRKITEFHPGPGKGVCKHRAHAMPRAKSQNPVLVTAPRLRFTSLKRGAAVRISNDELGYELEAPVEFVEFLKFFRKPRKLSELQKNFEGVPDDVLRLLTERSLLIGTEQRDLFRHGSIHQSVETAIGHAMTVAQAVDAKPSKGPRFAILGAGIDSGAGGDGGARHGPSAIRRNCPLRFSTLDPRGLPDPKKKIPTVWDLEFHRRVDLGAVEVRDLGDVHHVTGESNAEFG